MTEAELSRLAELYPHSGNVLALVGEVRRLLEVERRHDALYAHFADVHAALGAHDDKTLTAAGSVRKLVADNERLRGLIKDDHQFCMAVPVNVVSNSGDRYECASCCRTAREGHAATCSMFMPSGDVR